MGKNYLPVTFFYDIITNGIEDILSRCPGPVANELRKTETSYRKDDAFYFDTFLTCTLNDIFNSISKWRSEGVDGSVYGLEYIENNLPCDKMSKLATVKLVNICRNLYIQNFLAPIARYLKDNGLIDTEKRTWGVLSAKATHSIVIVDNLGDWRINEYMRLLESGCLDELYMMSGVPKPDCEEDLIGFNKHVELSRKRYDLNRAFEIKVNTIIDILKNKIERGDVEYVLKLGLIKQDDDAFALNMDKINDFVANNQISLDIKDSICIPDEVTYIDKELDRPSVNDVFKSFVTKKSYSSMNEDSEARVLPFTKNSKINAI